MKVDQSSAPAAVRRARKAGAPGEAGLCGAWHSIFKEFLIEISSIQITANPEWTTTGPLLRASSITSLLHVPSEFNANDQGPVA